MNNKILIFCLLTILTLSFVSAQSINYKERCPWTRPATIYRPEKVFNVGVWGRLSNGSMTCFIPGNPRRAAIVAETPVVVAPVVTPQEPVCSEVKTCVDWDNRTICEPPVCSWIIIRGHPSWRCNPPICHNETYCDNYKTTEVCA